MFVAIEGIDASGKATQAKILADRLGSHHLYSFPEYSSPTGHLILGHLKRYWSALPDEGSADAKVQVGDVGILNATVFQSLQLVNLMEFAEQINRAIAVGNHVVADRYWASVAAYGQADGLQLPWLTEIHKSLPQPDLNLLLDIELRQSLERCPERRDRYEEQEGLMETVAVLYRQLWRVMGEEHGRRYWVVIDGRGSIGEVTDQIWKAVERLL